MQWIFENIDKIMLVLTSTVTLASAITALTPTPKDDAMVAKVYEVVEKLALVVGKAKQ